MTSSTRHDKGKPTLYLYLSHSSTDFVLGRRLRKLLTQRLNAQVFTAEDVSAGEDWLTKMRSELQRADAVVALLTPHSAQSNWVLHELGAAWALEKPIIPVVTRRDVLNNLPLALSQASIVEVGDLEDAVRTDQFMRSFEHAVSALHVGAGA